MPTSNGMHCQYTTTTSQFSKDFFSKGRVFKFRFCYFRKYEEIYPPDVSEFCYITDDTYTKKQVLRMEHLILDVLAFECSPPTGHYFANHFSKLSGCAGT